MKQHPSVAPPLSDEELLALFRSRDERAVSETDRKYRRLLDSVARGILPDGQDREECLNDTYLKLWSAIPPAAPQSLRAYLVQILRRTALDRYETNRRERRMPASATLPIEDFAELLPAPAGEGVDEGVQAEALSLLINRFLREQSERRRFIFIEHLYLCTPIPAIARTLGVTQSAVYKELTRTKTALKEYLAENGVYV